MASEKQTTAQTFEKLSPVLEIIYVMVKHIISYLDVYAEDINAKNTSEFKAVYSSLLKVKEEMDKIYLVDLNQMEMPQDTPKSNQKTQTVETPQQPKADTEETSTPQTKQTEAPQNQDTATTPNENPTPEQEAPKPTATSNNSSQQSDDDSDGETINSILDELRQLREQN